MMRRKREAKNGQILSVVNVCYISKVAINLHTA
jgi:hypothetical protein